MAWLCRNGLVLRSSSDLHRWNVDGVGCLSSGARVTGGNCCFSGGWFLTMVLARGLVSWKKFLLLKDCVCTGWCPMRCEENGERGG